jgi:hypothetical protein
LTGRINAMITNDLRGLIFDKRQPLHVRNGRADPTWRHD